MSWPLIERVAWPVARSKRHWNRRPPLHNSKSQLAAGAFHLRRALDGQIADPMQAEAVGIGARIDAVGLAPRSGPCRRP